MVTQMHTDVLDFDEQLRGPLHTWKLHNAGLKKGALELPDGSAVFFGDDEWHGEERASVARLYNDGTSRSFPVDPQSPWYLDAVATGVPGEFAAVRVTNSDRAVVDRLSFKF
jgi:hypothetical protein